LIINLSIKTNSKVENKDSYRLLIDETLVTDTMWKPTKNTKYSLRSTVDDTLITPDPIRKIEGYVMRYRVPITVSRVEAEQ